MWEARVRPGAQDELVALIRRHWTALSQVDGFVSGELYRSDDGEPRLVLVTRWRDEAALAAAAGPGWRATAVPLPGEEPLHARPPHVWHFTAVPLPPP